MASGKDSQPPNRDSPRSQAPGSLGQSCRGIAGAAPSPASVPAFTLSRSLLPPQEKPDTQWPVAGPHRKAGRWPTWEPQEPAAASAAVGPDGRPQASDRSSPGSARPDSGPAPAPSRGTSHCRSAALPPHEHPSGSLEPTSCTLRVPTRLPGGLLIRSPVCSHGGGLNTVFIVTFPDLLLTTSQALRKKTECPQPPDRLGGGSWPRVGNGPVDRLHNVWKMPLRERWGCWEGGPGFPKWGSPGGGMQDRGPGRGGGGPGSWGRMGGLGLESWHKNLHRTRGRLRKFWAPRRTGREAGTAGPLQWVLPGCVGRGHQGPRPTLGSGDGGVKGSVPHSVSGSTTA